MIFVTVGTPFQPFDRLISAVEAVADVAQRFGDLVIQHGYSRRPSVGKCVAMLPRLDFERHVSDAVAVISHAGVGTVLESLRQGKRPIVMPRLAAWKETVSDHQCELARKLSSLGLVLVAEEADALREYLLMPASAFRVAPPGQNRLVIELLRGFIESVG